MTMMRDSCPHCGHRREPYLMSSDPNAPGLKELWQGNGDPMMQFIAKAGTIILTALILAGILLMLHINPWT